MITENDLAPGAYKCIAQALYEQFDGDDWRGRVVVAVDTLDGGTAYVEVHASVLLWWDPISTPDGDSQQLHAVQALTWETGLVGLNTKLDINWGKVADELFKL